MSSNQKQPVVNIAESTVLACLERLPRIRTHERTANCETVQRLKAEGRVKVKQDSRGVWWLSEAAEQVREQATLAASAVRKAWGVKTK